MIFELARSGGLGECRHVVGDLHCWLSDFIHRVVVHRRDEALRGWRNWLREDPLVRPHKWLSSGLTWCSSVSLTLRTVVQESLLIQPSLRTRATWNLEASSTMFTMIDSRPSRFLFK